MATFLRRWADEIILDTQEGRLDKPFMDIYSSATVVSVDLNALILDHNRVLCRLLMRILCTGEWNINAG